ncbi:hypothetical protein EV421DRAFT_2041547 [Armillaria borealis]|uniref:F-box domain-containing protein n=1 Tax=Armillaria borealis TaxID=47425 RepID=A0AA39ME30_9AGAR|nr:hypothetical protein EV421DRAFT_2041547 [Armillaria borealis]
MSMALEIPLLSDYEATYRTHKHYLLFSWPFLTHYEKYATDLRLFDKEDEWNNNNKFRYVRLQTFFSEMEGFYTGCLDLRGRHSARFIFLKSVWDEFLGDFEKLEPHVEGKSLGYTDELGMIEYLSQKVSLWEKLRSKWLIHENGYEFVTCWVDKILGHMSDANSTPIFQKHYLLDLPEELLELIMQNGRLEDVRILSATCRRLRTISQPYIFTSRRLVLNAPDIQDVLIIPEETRKAAMFELFLKLQIQSLSDVYFLLSRSDIIQKIKTVHIQILGAVNDEMKRHKIDLDLGPHIQSIEHAFCMVLATMQNLTFLSVSSFSLIHRLLPVITSLPHLQTLKLATSSSFFIHFLPLPSNVINRIENLVLTLHPGSTLASALSEIWADSLKNLFIFYPPRYNPAPVLNMCAMERVSLSCLPRIWVDVVEEMLRISPSSDARRLTHLKLEFCEPISDGDVDTLLHALQSYPMEVLVLDGLLQGYSTIISAIAQRLPDLLVLTLFLRGGSAQSISTGCVWPEPIWVYAPHFAQFTRLRHFEWNYLYNKEEFVTPWSLLLLEGHGNQDVSVLPYLAGKSDDYEDTEDVLYVASVFRAYCRAPKLRVVYNCTYGPSRCWQWHVNSDNRPDLDFLDFEWNPRQHGRYLDDSCQWW